MREGVWILTVPVVVHLDVIFIVVDPDDVWEYVLHAFRHYFFFVIGLLVILQRHHKLACRLFSGRLAAFFGKVFCGSEIGASTHETFF